MQHSQEVVGGPSHCSTCDALHLSTVCPGVAEVSPSFATDSSLCSGHIHATDFHDYTISTCRKQSCNLCLSCSLKLFLATGFSAFHISPAHFTFLTNDTQIQHESKVLLEDVPNKSPELLKQRARTKVSVLSESQTTFIFAFVQNVPVDRRIASMNAFEGPEHLVKSLRKKASNVLSFNAGEGEIPTLAALENTSTCLGLRWRHWKLLEQQHQEERTQAERYVSMSCCKYRRVRARARTRTHWLLLLSSQISKIIIAAGLLQLSGRWKESKKQKKWCWRWWTSPPDAWWQHAWFRPTGGQSVRSWGSCCPTTLLHLKGCLTNQPEYLVGADVPQLQPSWYEAFSSEHEAEELKRRVHLLFLRGQFITFHSVLERSLIQPPKVYVIFPRASNIKEIYST